MRKEIFKVKCPNHIVVGDPWYFERCSDEELKRLVADYQVPAYWDARLVLKEKAGEEYPDMTMRFMEIYLAPNQEIGIYLDNMMYEGQEQVQKNLAVDTARYKMCVDGREEIIHTGGDGYWGAAQEFYHTQQGRKNLDAVILTVLFPDNETFEGMKRCGNYLFEHMEVLETERKKSKIITPER